MNFCDFDALAAVEAGGLPFPRGAARRFIGAAAKKARAVFARKRAGR